MKRKGGSTPFDFNFEKWTKTKPKSSISNDIQDKINIITMNPDNYIPFGSWTYKSQLYPGDVDLMEAAEHCCDRESAVKYFVGEIKKIVRKILKVKLLYLGDVKAGIDERYVVDIGKIEYGPSTKITGYDPKYIIKQIVKLAGDGLLTKDEVMKLGAMLKDNISVEDFEKLSDFFRSKWLLRWNAKELLNGFKVLPGKLKYTLGDAIQDNTMTKIDLWGQINARFIEITNVYMLYYIDEYGQRVLLNFENDLRLMVQKLTDEANKFLYSPTYFNPFKMIKRIWSISRITGNKEMIKKLTPFMQSDMGRLSQIKSEIETLIGILENVKRPPVKTIYKQIDSFKSRFANVYQVYFEEDKVDGILSSILSKQNTKYTIEHLEYILKYVKLVINTNTMEFINNTM